MGSARAGSNPVAVACSAAQPPRQGSKWRKAAKIQRAVMSDTKRAAEGNEIIPAVGLNPNLEVPGSFPGYGMRRVLRAGSLEWIRMLYQDVLTAKRSRCFLSPRPVAAP